MSENKATHSVIGREDRTIGNVHVKVELPELRDILQQAIARPPPKVYVETAASDIHVAAPQVNVEAPHVDVRPEIHVQVPETKLPQPCINVVGSPNHIHVNIDKRAIWALLILLSLLLVSQSFLIFQKYLPEF